MQNEQKNNRFAVHVEKAFTEPAEKVFDAWLDIKFLGKWMFGPSVRKEEIVSLTNDPVTNGRFSFKVKRDADVLDHMGTYLEISRPTKLVFTWGVDTEPGDESIVTIIISSTDSGCILSLTHDMDSKWSEYGERTKQGWSYMIDLLHDRVKDF